MTCETCARLTAEVERLRKITDAQSEWIDGAINLYPILANLPMKDGEGGLT